MAVNLKWLGVAAATLLVSGCCWNGHKYGSARGYAVVVPVPDEVTAEALRAGRLDTRGASDGDVSEIGVGGRRGRVAPWVSAWGNFVRQIGGSSVYYDFDVSSLSTDAISRLTRMVRFLRRNPEAQVIVDGHTDATGTREYNLGLGERRAQAVRDFMVVRGIEPRRIRTRSYGEESLIARGAAERDHALNRRAVVSARQ